MDGSTTDGSGIAQVLVSMGELKTQLAVLGEQLKAVPDHENRIRTLERFRFTLAGLSVIGGVAAGTVGYLIGHLLAH